MRKLKNLAVITFVLLASIAFAQVEIKPDPRLYQSFSKEYIEDLASSNPRLLAYYNFYLDNSFKIEQINPNKHSFCLELSTITCNNGATPLVSNDIIKNGLNPFFYNFKRDLRNPVYYLVNKDYELVIYSTEFIEYSFNKFYSENILNKK